MNLSVSEAAKQWGVSRTTIYHKINNGELSRGSDKRIDVSEMLRVFGEPLNDERHDNVLNKTVNTVQKTPMDTKFEQLDTLNLEHELELERLKNEYLEQQVKDQKNLIEDYQQQIKQLNNSLAQATASINEFAQTRLLELKINQTHYDEENLQEDQHIHTDLKLKNQKIDEDNHSATPSKQDRSIQSRRKIFGIF